MGRRQRFPPLCLCLRRQQMPRNHDKTRRSRRKLAPFIALERYITASPAWKSLSLAARCAYLELLALYNGSNNGRIALSARTLASRLPISRATASRALRELEDRGFIEVTRPGGFNLKSGDRRATEWRLNRFFCDATSKAASKAFMRWMPPKSNCRFIREPQRFHQRATRDWHEIELPKGGSRMKPTEQLRAISRPHHRAPYRYLPYALSKGARTAQRI
jgi:hypothetical protein